MQDGVREVGEMRWGFTVPDRLIFNAQSEGIATSKFSKEMLTKRRCIVPAGSLFRWKETAPEPWPKYTLSVKGRHVLGMAAVWQPWINPKTGQWENTFAIITSDPNAKMCEIHNWQPVILEDTGVCGVVVRMTFDPPSSCGL